MAEKGDSSSFVFGVSFFLILALLIPGAVATAFIAWLFGSARLLSVTGDTSFTVTNGLTFSLVVGLVLTPFSFACEVACRSLHSRWRRDNSFDMWKTYSSTVLSGESAGKIGWYFYQVWGQFIMHWNIATSLIVVAVAYLFKGIFVSQDKAVCELPQNFIHHCWQSV